jgi:hypothetical protein
VPLRHDRALARGLRRPDEAALHAERSAGLLDRDALQRVEIELRADAPPDLRDEPLTLERLGERRRRARPLERQRRLGDERADRRELLRREGPVLGRRNGEHRDHPAARDERDERGALRTGVPRELTVEAGRLRQVVHDDRRGLEHRARNSRRLLRQIEVRVDPRLEVVAVEPREQAARLAQLRVDEREPDELDVEQLRDLVEQHPGDRFGVPRAAESAVDDLDRFELAFEHAASTPGTARASPRKRVSSEQSNLACSTHGTLMIGATATARRRVSTAFRVIG